MLALENSNGEGERTKEDPVDFLGESISVSVSLGEESVKSAEQAEEVVMVVLRELGLPLLSSPSSVSPSEESEEFPVKGIDLI